MSPIAIPDPKPPTFGKNPSSSRGSHVNDLPRIQALDIIPSPVDAAWVNLNARRSGSTQSRRPTLPPMHEFPPSSSSRPLSPNQTRIHSSMIYSRSANTSYPPDNPLPPPFTSNQHQSYVYPSYSDSHYPMYDPSHSLPDPLTHTHLRPSTVPSIHKGENPYPILSRSGTTVPPAYFYP
ncbi:hypothetical protein BD779DRAFT_325432 [Infundibulicybe gibba]|nr:hypothetical protein BD779DRAFT_325432 [Infundibulicybe gibba]